MARFRSRRRRFGRRRRIGGVRRARRVLKAVKRVRRKKTLRKKRQKQYFYGYSGANHIDGAVGTIRVTGADPSASARTGLFAYDDINEILEQVKNVDDLIYPSMSFGGRNAGRLNITARVKGTQTYQVSNGNKAGAIWLEVYICRPRKGIPASGVGAFNDVSAADAINSNLNQNFVTDYNDARAITISAAGTGGVTNILQNAQTQTKPTVNSTNYVITPYMVPTFTQNWKVVSHKKYVLPAGGQCMFALKSRAIVNRNQVSRGTGTGTALADYHTYRPWYGREVFFRFHGQLIHDTTTETKVDFAPCALDVAFTKKYWYSTSHRNIPSYVLRANENQSAGGAPTGTLPSGATVAADEN